jgi:hypothetical protein
MAARPDNSLSLLARSWFPLCLAVVLLVALLGLVLIVLHVSGYAGPVNEWLEENLQLSYEFPLHWVIALLLFQVPIAILLLYFLKLKRKPLQVPSTFLWRKSIEDLHVNALFQWLRQNVLLLLQLLTVLLLIFAIVGIRFHGMTVKGKNYIILIDSSASMSASDVKPSRLEWAKEEALKVIDSYGDDNFGMVIEVNSKVMLRQTSTSDREALKAAVRAIKQTHRQTQIDDAIKFAVGLANPLHSTEDRAMQPRDVPPGQERTIDAPKPVPTDLHIFSDGGFADPSEATVADLNSLRLGNTSALSNLQVYFHLAGNPGPENVDNVGIIDFNIVRLLPTAAKPVDPNQQRLEAFVHVRNYRPDEAKVKLLLDLYVNGELQYTDQKTVTLPKRTPVDDKPPPPKDKGSKDEEGLARPRYRAGEARLTFELPPLDIRASTVLHAYLDQHTDAFKDDDKASLVVGMRRKAKVLHVGPDNPFLDAFFNQPATQKVSAVTRLAPGDLKKDAYRQAAASGEYDLVLFDGCIPETERDMPQANTFCLDNPPPPWRRGSKKVKDFIPLISKKDHPLMTHVTSLWDVGVSEAFFFDVRDLDQKKAVRPFNLSGDEKGNRPLPQVTRLLEARGDAPVLFTLPRGSYTDLVLAFPIPHSFDEDWMTNWHVKESFVLFLRSVLYHLGRVHEEGVREPGVPPGELMSLRPEAGIRSITVTTPDGKDAQTLKRGDRPDFAYGRTEQLGVYTVKHDDDTRRNFAINLFDTQESDLEPRNWFKVGNETVTADTERRQPRELWKWIVLGGVLLLLVEWYIYNRRVYV